MPLYEYECTKCHRRTEKIETLAGPHLKKCPYCGGKVEQTLTAPAIQFKGSGWYVTDYAGKKSGSGEGAPAKDGGSTDKTATKDSARETAKEPKPKKEAKK